MPKSNHKQAAEIGCRIKEKRKELGLTQEEAANRAGLSQQFLACVESGKKGLGFDSIIKLSRALDISVDYLLTGVATQQELDQMQSLLIPLDEPQRQELFQIIKSILRLNGFTAEETEDQ